MQRIHIGWALVGVALLLVFLQSTHNLPSGYGIEDFLAFTDPHAINEAIRRWAPVKWYGFAYLSLDLIAFIPLYALATLRVVAWLRGRANGEDEQGAMRVFGWLIVAALAWLLVDDLVETALGLAKLAGEDAAPAVGTAAIPFAGAAALLCTLISLGGLALVGWNTLAREDPGAASEDQGGRGRLVRGDCRAATAGAAIGLVWLVACALAVGSTGSAYCAAPDLELRVGCIAHQSKTTFLIWLWGGTLVAGLLAWFSGANARRARLRSVVFDVVARSRYTVISLAVLAALLVGLNQCRDVLVGTVSDIGSGPGSGGTLEEWMTAVVSLVSLWTLSHTCWLWARVQSRVPGTHRILAGSHWPEEPDAEAIARVWARVLGTVPLLLFAALASKALSALAAAALVRNATSDVGRDMGELFVTALIAIVVGAAFLISRELVGPRQEKFRNEEAKNQEIEPVAERYYDDPISLRKRKGAPDGTGQLRFAEWKGPRWEFWGVVPNAPVWLPLASFAAMVLARAPVNPESHAWLPMAFPVLLFAFSAGIGFLGWISVYERRYAMPWGLIPLILAGWFGTKGWTDNHIVALPDSIGTELWDLWVRSAMLALIIGVAGWWAIADAPDRRPRVKGAVLIAIVGALGACLWISDQVKHVGALHSADAGDVDGGFAQPAREAPPRETKPPRGDNPCVEKTCLQPALRDWIANLKADADNEQKTSSGGAPAGRRGIYFVATEGGGSRAAYWTAKVLEKMSVRYGESEHGDFLAHTFAISGVSGGSVGAAAFIACDRDFHNKAGKVGECLARFGRTDLISPLLGAWFFEDMVARVLPTSWCKQPGCGFISRSIWFETALTRQVGSLAETLRQRPPDRHQPYLLLNSTWVEGGGRVIASDLRIDPWDFPGAIGMRELMPPDLALVTAAHNSARFPFVNAIGLVKTRNCIRKADHRATGIIAPSNEEVRCLHLADGGYFDNSGAQSLIDVVRALRTWMHNTSKCAKERCDNSVLREDQELVEWVQTHLEPRILLIHNGANDIPCEVSKAKQPDSEAVGCVGSRDGEWAPHLPVPRPVLDFFSDAVGPAVTVVTAGGLGANRQRADALLCAELVGLNGEWGSAQGSEPQLVRVAQTEDGQLYPLGWYLSANARAAMDHQIRDIDADGEGKGVVTTTPCARQRRITRD